MTVEKEGVKQPLSPPFQSSTQPEANFYMKKESLEGAITELHILVQVCQEKEIIVIYCMLLGIRPTGFNGTFSQVRVPI